MGLVFPLTLTRVRSVFVLGIVLIGNGVIPCSYFVFFYYLFVLFGMDLGVTERQKQKRIK